MRAIGAAVADGYGGVGGALRVGVYVCRGRGTGSKR